VEAFFDCSLDELLGRASAHASASWPLRTRDGRQLFAVCVASRAACRGARSVAKARAAGGHLPGRCRLQADFRKALRVFERDVPLLINGETGSGKEAFAKAVHRPASAPTRPSSPSTARRSRKA
jgi:transcriptional regulator of acetoin/glycerol metabolism